MEGQPITKVKLRHRKVSIDLASDSANSVEKLVEKVKEQEIANQDVQMEIKSMHRK